MYLLILSSLWGLSLGATFSRVPPVYRQDLPAIPPDVVAPTPIPIISYNFQPNNGDGTYAWSFESANGIKAEESGAQKELGKDETGPIYGNAAKGSYTYRDNDGQIVTIVYTADERGFLPEGDHLPTPPPPSEEIYRSLEAAAEAQRLQGLPIAPAYNLFLKHARKHRYRI